jgi:hypothetical protein
MSLSELPGGGSRMPISQSVPETSAMVPNVQVSQFSTQGLTVYDPPVRIQTVLAPQSAERARSNMSGKSSPPQAFAHSGQSIYNYQTALSSSLGGLGIPLSFQQMTNIGGATGPSHFGGRSFSENMHTLHMSAQQQQLHASLSDLYDVTIFQMPQPLPPIMGAQSFSGVYNQGMPRSHYPHVESELGYALQRPGVVPGMGSDAFVSPQGQTSHLNFNSAGLLSQPSQMLSPSLSNLSSPTPRNHFAAPGLNSIYQPVSISPGGLFLQKLGLQDQMIGNQSNTAGAGISLLSQQLEEYSHADQQQGQFNSFTHTQYNMPGGFNTTSSRILNPGSCHGGFDAPPATVQMMHPGHLFDAQRASFSDLSGMHRNQNISAPYGMINHRGSNDEPGATPMSLTSIPCYNRQHANSFSDFGRNKQDEGGPRLEP